jgi:hypothetical protein
MHDLFCSLKIPKSIDYIHYFLSVLMLEGGMGLLLMSKYKPSIKFILF